MTLRRKVRSLPADYLPPAPEFMLSSGWMLDEELSQIMDNVRDPFATYAEPNTYLAYTQAYEINTCLDSVVAGIAERLGYPAGLSFEDVFCRL